MREKRKVMPPDIVHHHFKRSLRGYNDFEVDEFLGDIKDTMEDILQENAEVKEKVKVLEDRLREFTLKEIALQNSLILAEKAAEERLQSAKKEADLIVERAKLEAEKVKDNNLQEMKDTLMEINTIKQQKQNFLVEFEVLLRSHLNMMRKDIPET